LSILITPTALFDEILLVFLIFIVWGLRLTKEWRISAYVFFVFGAYSILMLARLKICVNACDSALVAVAYKVAIFGQQSKDLSRTNLNCELRPNGVDMIWPMHHRVQLLGFIFNSVAIQSVRKDDLDSISC
jgi:hypothetical protein